MTRRRRVNLTKTCRVVACGRTTGRTRLCTPCTGHVEQRLAFGDLPHEAARRIGTTVGDVIRVGEHMDAAAAHEDDTRAGFGDNCRKKLHQLTPENLYIDPHGRRFCRPCKQDHRRASYERERKAS